MLRIDSPVKDIAITEDRLRAGRGQPARVRGRGLGAGPVRQLPDAARSGSSSSATSRSRTSATGRGALGQASVRAARVDRRQPARTRGPRRSSQRSGGTRSITRLNDTNSDARFSTISTTSTMLRVVRSALEHDDEPEHAAEHVRAGVAEHQPLAEVLGQQADGARR